MQQGILGAIEQLGAANNGKSDKETLVLIKQIIQAMEQKKRSLWPSKELRESVNSLDNLQRLLFIETLKDMEQALEEHFSVVKEV